MKVREILSRHWQILPEPPLADPDADLLWEAERAAREVHALAERPDVSGLLRTMALADPILSGLGFGTGRIDIIETDDRHILRYAQPPSGDSP